MVTKDEQKIIEEEKKIEQIFEQEQEIEPEQESEISKNIQLLLDTQNDVLRLKKKTDFSIIFQIILFVLIVTIWFVK